MSFKFGAFDTSTMAGMTATLKAWPSMAPEPELIPQLDGALYGRTRLATVDIEFDVVLTSNSPAATLALHQQLVAGIAPHLGVMTLIPEASGVWGWRATASGVSSFERTEWQPTGSKCTLVGTVKFTAIDGVARAFPDVTASGGSSVSITPLGNLVAYPRIEVSGPFSSTTVTAGGISTTVTQNVASGSKLVLDYSTRDFGVWSGSVKTANVAQAMSNLARVGLNPGLPNTITASAGSLAVTANSRRG